jgi:hypothetical protein
MSDIIKSKYDIIYLSDDIGSVISAFYAAKKGMDVLLLDQLPQHTKDNGDFKLYPFELPLLNVERKDYLANLFTFISLPKKEAIVGKCAIPFTIIYGSKKIEFHVDHIEQEITREFLEHRDELLGFIQHVLELDDITPPLWMPESGFPVTGASDIYKVLTRFPSRVRKLLVSDVRHLYKKHHLPPELCRILDAVLFVLSGTHTRYFPSFHAVRLLASLLKGVDVLSQPSLRLRDEMLAQLPAVATVRKVNISEHKQSSKNISIRLNNFEGWTSADYLVSDIYSRDFRTNGVDIFNMDLFFPFTIYVWVENGYIPECMSEWMLYLDVDKARWFGNEDIYSIRHSREDAGSLIRLTSFISRRNYSSPLKFFREKSMKMFYVLRSILPFIDYGCVRTYPDPFSSNFDIEADVILREALLGEYIFENFKRRFPRCTRDGRKYQCGRQILPHLGFEGSVISGLKVADLVSRR